MSVSVDAGALARALGAVVPAAQTAVYPGPGLARLAVSPDDGGFAQAIGLEITATAQFPVQAVPLETMEVFIPAKKVANMLTVLGPIMVELDVEDDVLHVRTPRSSMTARGMVVDSPAALPYAVMAQKAPWWPSLPELAYAASTDQTKPTLQALQLADGWAFCTDSYRIAARRTDYSGDPMLIPAELVREAELVCGEIEGVAAAEGRLSAFGAEGWVRAALVQAQPLNWRQLAPIEEAKPHGSFAAGAMAEGLRVCRTALEDLTHGHARVTLTGHVDFIELAVGGVADPLTVVATIEATGADFKKTTFNPIFLASAIDQIGRENDEIHYHQIDKTRSWFGMFTPTADPTAADQFAVVVPYHA